MTLPRGANAALAGYGNFCKSKLRMPTTIVGQNGKKVTQRTKLEVAGCKEKRVGRQNTPSPSIGIVAGSASSCGFTDSRVRSCLQRSTSLYAYCVSAWL